MSSFWPRRRFPLPMSAGWINDEKVAHIRRALGAGHLSRVTAPVILDTAGCVRLLELFYIGDDGVGDGQLLLQVVENRIIRSEPHIALKIVPYPALQSPQEGMPTVLRPSEGGKLLDGYVKKLRDIRPELECSNF